VLVWRFVDTGDMVVEPFCCFRAPTLEAPAPPTKLGGASRLRRPEIFRAAVNITRPAPSRRWISRWREIGALVVLNDERILLPIVAIIGITLISSFNPISPSLQRMLETTPQNYRAAMGYTMEKGRQKTAKGGRNGHVKALFNRLLAL